VLFGEQHDIRRWRPPASRYAAGLTADAPGGSLTGTGCGAVA
jgi:hypothetical protein